MSIEIDVNNFVEVLKVYQSHQEHVNCYLTKNQISFLRFGQYDLIEYSISLSTIVINKPKTFKILISDWISALKKCQRAIINVIDFILVAHSSWGKIKVFSEEIVDSFDNIIPSCGKKFVLSIDALTTITDHLKNSKIIYIQSQNNVLIFTDDYQRNIISVPNENLITIKETAFDCALVSNCLLNNSTSPYVALSFGKNSPLHIEYEFFFQNKLRFIIAPIIEEEQSQN